MTRAWSSSLLVAGFLLGGCGDSAGTGASGADGSGGRPDGGNGAVGGNPSEGGGSSVTCGNGMIDPGESCDGTNLAGHDCSSQGFGSGTLLCSPSCSFDTSGCGDATCGDGVADAGEDCDGADLAGASCATQGFQGGRLACSRACQFDATACTSAAGCGDGVVGAGEECDGTALDGETCVSLGYDAGALTCSPACAFDASQCTLGGDCGDGTVDAGEQCDDGNTTGGDGCSATCQAEGVPPTWTCNALYYDAQDGCDCSCGAHDPDCDLGEALYCGGTPAPPETMCINDVCNTPPPVCGDGTVQTGEQCDDGNTSSGDGCSSTCQHESAPPGWTCDPTFYNALDGCDCSCGAHDPDCEVAGQGLFCSGTPAPPGSMCVNDVCNTPPVVCGNGILQTGEECDDGNTTNGDGCSSTCQTEPPPPTWTCNPLYYAHQDGCDCSCGAHDPDCNIAGQTLFCDGQLAPPNEVCTNDVCIP